MSKTRGLDHLDPENALAMRPNEWPWRSAGGRRCRPARASIWCGIWPQCRLACCRRHPNRGFGITSTRCAAANPWLPEQRRFDPPGKASVTLPIFGAVMRQSARCGGFFFATLGVGKRVIAEVFGGVR